MITPFATRHLVWEEPASVPHRPFGIVLGCGVRDGRPSLVLADRLRAGLALLRAQAARRLVISGNAAQVPVMMRWLEEHGVDEGALIADPEGVRTLATMRRATVDFGVEGAIVCTNRFHVHRAVFLARAVGIDAVGLACDRHVYGSRREHETRELAAWARALFDVYTGRAR